MQENVKKIFFNFIRRFYISPSFSVIHHHIHLTYMYIYVHVYIYTQRKDECRDLLPNLCLALDKWLEREGGCREDEILADGVTIHLTNASKPLAFSFPMEFPHQMFHSKPM